MGSDIWRDLPYPLKNSGAFSFPKPTVCTKSVLCVTRQMLYNFSQITFLTVELDNSVSSSGVGGVGNLLFFFFFSAQN